MADILAFPNFGHISSTDRLLSNAKLPEEFDTF